MMSGKRLLDAVALFNVTRAVTYHHLSIRRSQFELYATTSSLARGIGQICNSTNNASSAVYSSTQDATGAAKAKPNSTLETFDQKTEEGEGQSAKAAENISQDHCYDMSQQNSMADSELNQDLIVRQDRGKNNRPPEGKIQFVHNGLRQASAYAQSFSPEYAMKLQRRSEAQIPSESAKRPTTETCSGSGEGPEFGVEQEQDVFQQPPGSTAPVLSALPRFKIPKKEEDIQGGDPRIPQNIDADVFYSHTKPSQGKLANPKLQEDLPEEMISSLCHSKHVAGLLGAKSTDTPGGTRPRGSRTYATRRSQFSQKSADLPRMHVEGFETEKVPDPDTESLRKLTANVAMDDSIEPHSSKNKVDLSAKPPYEMRESRVPSSQLGRLWEFGGLAASMAFGAAGESFNWSMGNSAEQSSFMLRAGNMDRLVAKLSKMRGAALKLGQMLSFQDSRMLPKPVREVLQRVQDSADYMPASQRNAVLAANLGNNWRDFFESFNEKPMAAASIGQVHGAVLRSSGRRVAVKVQYPGVAASISSDLNNLSILLSATRLLPKGLYLDKTIANARTELAWECDYVREGECAKRFKELLADDQNTFTVPAIVDEASGKQVLTMELMEGTAVTKIQTVTQEQKDWIGTQILRLCLREIVEFNYMQTDPNWTNFLYNSKNSRLELLDFGASRGFPRKFIDLYVQNLAAAARGDREACQKLSIELGYLTGYESKAMLDAHVDSVMTLAEPFTESAPEVYNFENQTITNRVRALIPVMIRERLAPPPEETYSLHRKLSGAFLLCARLGSHVRCKEMFQQALAKSGAV